MVRPNGPAERNHGRASKAGAEAVARESHDGGYALDDQAERELSGCPGALRQASGEARAKSARRTIGDHRKG